MWSHNNFCISYPNVFWIFDVWSFNIKTLFSHIRQTIRRTLWNKRPQTAAACSWGNDIRLWSTAVVLLKSLLNSVCLFYLWRRGLRGLNFRWFSKKFLLWVHKGKILETHGKNHQVYTVACVTHVFVHTRSQDHFHSKKFTHVLFIFTLNAFHTYAVLLDILFYQICERGQAWLLHRGS